MFSVDGRIGVVPSRLMMCGGDGMRRLLIVLSGWVLAAVLLLAGGAQWVASQAPFRSGAFVAGQDGSRWIVGNGERLRINFALDDSNALAGLPEGRSVSTVDEAVAALSGGATSPV